VLRRLLYRETILYNKLYDSMLFEGEFFMYKKLIKRCTGVLAAILLCTGTVSPVFAEGSLDSGTNQAAKGIEQIGAEDADFYELLWELVQEEGEDVITFPSRIRETLEPGAAAYYGFYLEKDTHLNIILEADYPCDLLLCQKDQPVNVQVLPFSTQKIEESSIPSGYYQIYVIPQQEYERESISFTLDLGSFSENDTEPDFSEFDLPGKIYNIMSPFNVYQGSDYPVFEVSDSSDPAPNRQPDNSKDKGGDALRAAGYYMSWQGPVDEDVMPSVEEATRATPSNYMQYVPELPRLHVQEMLVLPSAENTADVGTGAYMEHWKNALMTYGAMEVGMMEEYEYWAISPEGEERKKYCYVPAEFYDRYRTELELYANHAVTLIGWDDTIPKERFHVQFNYKTPDGKTHTGDYIPPGDGAWIIRNSWGEDVHAGGDFYISYYDAVMGTDIDHSVYGQLEDWGNYNHLYTNSVTISRAMGSEQAAKIFAGRTKGMASEEFINETGQDELLRAVTFGSPYSGYRYKIYVAVGDEEPRKVKEGYINYAGVHTVRLDNGVLISPDEVFRVYLALELPVKAQKDVGMFYSTDFGGDYAERVGRMALYYPKGDADFKDSVSTSEDGDFPVIQAYCYTDLSGYGGEDVSLITLPDFDARVPDSPRITVEQTRGAEIQYEEGVDLESLEDGSIFAQYKIEYKNGKTSGVRTAGPENAGDEAATVTSPATAGNYKEPVGSGDDAKVTENKKDFFPGKPATAGNYPKEARALSSGSKGDATDESRPRTNTGMEHDPSAYSVDYRDYNGGVMKIELPEKYNLAALGQVTPVRNQAASCQCWAFAATKAVESAMMKNYQRLVSYPRGIRVTAEDGASIINGVVDLSYEKGETRSLVLKPELVTDDNTKLDNDMIVWSYEGDLDCITGLLSSTKNGVPVTVLKTVKSSGVVTLTATSRSDPNLTVRLTVRITEKVPAVITLSDSMLELRKGESYTLTAFVESAEDLQVIWTSDNPAVATVDQNGRVYAIKPGRAVITARAGDASATCIVLVSGSSLGGGFSLGGGSSRGSSSSGSAVYSNGSSVPITEGTWQQAEDGSWSFIEKLSGSRAVGWRYIRTSDGQYRWFKFGQDTRMLMGWVCEPDGRWYYLASPGDQTELSNAGQTGAMVTGWFQDPSDGHRYYLDLASGAMTVGERTMNGKKYYFNRFSAGTTGWHFEEATQTWRFGGGTVTPMGALLSEEASP